MNITFHIIYSMLKSVSAATGLTYNEINIVVYYFLIPLVLLLLVDRIINKYAFSVFTVVFWTVFLLLIPDFSRFCDRLFEASVAFLNLFSSIGWNYIVASVMVCVVAPIVVFAVLFYFAFPQIFRRRAQANTSRES